VSGFGGNGKKVNITMPTKIFGVEIATIAKLIPGFEMPVFGGTGGGCLLDGPFKNRTVRIGPMGQMTPNNTRCLTRNFNAQIAKSSSSKVSLAQVLSAKTFNEFTRWMEAGNPQFHGFTPGKGLNFTNHGDMHDIGHGGIGGEVSYPAPTL
jgi:tyrosinase